jgi:hypothetical protein
MVISLVLRGERNQISYESSRNSTFSGALMKKMAFLLWLCITNVAAQQLYLYPAKVVAPRGSYQTVTAIVNGVNDKSVTWSTTGGKLVGTNPCVVNEPCTIALYTTTAGTYTVTATSNANSSVTATSTVTVTASPTPVTAHPRFLITPTNLPALRAKATTGNVIYQDIRTQAIAYYATDNRLWSWSCNSGNGQPSSSQTGSYKEYDAYYYAYMALMDPSDATYNWACYAHDVGIYVMSNYVSGGVPGSANEWSDSSHAMALLPDWMIGSGAISSSADLATARAFLAYMANLVLNYGGTQNPAGAYNSSAMFSTGSPYDLDGIRTDGGNNYNLSRMLYLAAAGLTFNDTTADDPALANTCGATRYQVCPDFTAGSLHAYAHYLFGAALYDYWAHIEDPSVSWQAYQAAFANLPKQPTCESTDLLMHPCFGDGRGGESSEGSWYQYSMYRMRYLFNMLYTSGNNDPILWGPQVSAGTSSWWDLKYVSDLEFLTGPVNQTNGPPGYNYLTTGDSNSYVRQVSDMWTEAAMLTSDSETGRTDRTNALKWINFNSAFGGPLGNLWGCTNYCGYDFQLSNPNWSSGSVFDMFLALPAGDPVAGTLPTDPRPSLPLDLYNGSFNQHGMVRSSWNSGSNTLFSYYFPNSMINHEYQFDGRFDIFANGEYITKGRTIFNDYNINMVAASNQNLISIINSTGSGCTTWRCENYQLFETGGQFPHASQAGLVTVNHSELPGYVAAIANTTKAYNGAKYGESFYPSYNDVKAASRSIVYLRGTNQVVFYDRAAVGHAASTQAIYQVTTGSPTISGSTASWLTRSRKQKAYFTSLLPAGGTVANIGLPCPSCKAGTQASDWEPVAEIEVTPPGSPLSTQFLSVLEFGASSMSASTTALVQSTSGQRFDGAMIGSSLVMFMRSWPAAFTGTTYPASGAKTQYVSDLKPNTKYSISGAGAPAAAIADTAGVLTFAAAGTGNITVGTSTAASLEKVAVAVSLLSLAALGAQGYSTICGRSGRSSTNRTGAVTRPSTEDGTALNCSSDVPDTVQ